MERYPLNALHRDRLVRLACTALGADITGEDLNEFRGTLSRLGCEALIKRIKSQRLSPPPSCNPPLQGVVKGCGQCLIYVENTSFISCNSGVQRVVRMLSRAAIESGIDVTLVKWADAEETFTVLSDAELLHLSKWNGPTLGISRRTCEERLQSLLSVKRNDSEVIPLIIPEIPYLGFGHNQKTNAIIEGAKRVGFTTNFVFYDAIPLQRAELKDDAKTHADYMRCLFEADSVVCISEASRIELIKFFIDEKDNLRCNGNLRIRTIHLPAESLIAKRCVQLSEAKSHQNYILSVGSITLHKNQVTLANAFDDYCKQNPATSLELLLAGHVHPNVAAELSSLLAANPKIRHLGAVSDSELYELYRGAAFTVFPSIQEGFGLPILESLWFGKPCICANFGAMGEIGQNYAAIIGVDTRDRQAIRGALESITNNPGELVRLATHAIEARLDTWVDYAREFFAFCCETGQARHIKRRPLVSIIIPTYKSPDFITDCIHALLNLDDLTAFEIIVVDDASDAQIKSILDARYHDPRLTTLRNGVNLRFAASCNAGARIASGEALLFLNDDTIPQSGFIDAMSSRLWSEDNIGIVGAKLLYPDGTIQHAGVKITPRPFCDNFDVEHIGRNAPSSLGEANIAAKVESVTGACLLIKGELFRSLNGFDERYVMYYEDIDLCLRARKMGFDIVYEPSAVVTHLESKSFTPGLNAIMSDAHALFSARWSHWVKGKGLVGDTALDGQSLEPVGGRPLLSIAITTYNRAGWLRENLRNIFTQHPFETEEVEVIVCDNASTDETEDVVSPYLQGRADFRYYRNEKNVGMLGNLKVTAEHSRGSYIWMIGDDDLICPNSIATVRDAILRYSAVSLIYINFKYTRETDPSSARDLVGFHSRATPIGFPTSNQFGLVSDICTISENFFTAIYCLIIRRDHAMKAYSSFRPGPAFSSLETCVPTTYYILNHMMSLSCLWIGSPQIVGNLNNSWTKYETVWLLERIPEILELALRQGACRREIGKWYSHNFDGFMHYMNHYLHGAEPLGFEFNVARFLKRVSISDDFHNFLLSLSRKEPRIVDEFLCGH